MIYFMRADEDGPVKIGWSLKVVDRFHQVKPTADTELTIIRLVDGPPWVERWFHGYFKEMRLNGEWFTFDPEMLTVQPPAEKPDEIKNSVSSQCVTEQITIRLPEDRVEALRQAARAEHRSLARQIEHLLARLDATHVEAKDPTP